MANIVIIGIDLSSGNSRPISPGDTPTDSAGIAANAATGIRGASGLAGPTGFIGASGSTGILGPTGIQGRTGIRGVDGRGFTGVGGVVGLTGADSLATGITGVAGVTGLRGATGAFPGYAAYSALNSATTITASAKICGIDVSGGPFTITLPPSGGLFIGQEFIFQDESGTAGTNNITIAASGGDSIAGSSTHVMTTNFEGADIMYGGNGAFYVLISQLGATGLLTQGVTGIQGVAGIAGETGIQGNTGVS